MWVFTTDGFYSAVQDRNNPDWLVVRCRTEEDARRLRDWLERNTVVWTEPAHTPNADYAWRLSVRKTDFAEYLVAAIQAIDYPNFKNAVGVRQGYERAHVYGEVWADLLELQHPRVSV